MAQILSVPFRFLPDGRAATVEQHSTAGRAEQIGVLILTERGEHPLAPGYGYTDPTWRRGLNSVELNAQLAVYGPLATVTRVAVDFTTMSNERITVEFE